MSIRVTISIEDQSVNKTSENPYDRPERLAWLIRAFEKHIDRFDAGRKSMYQKATWSLATASGFFALSSLAKSEPMRMFIKNQMEQLETLDRIVVAVALLLAATYAILLIQVTNFYSPREIEYPLQPINPELGAEMSRCENNKKSGDECWNYVQVTYVKPEDLECYSNVLRGHIDAHIKQSSLNQELSEHLKDIFRIWAILVILFFTLIFLG